MDAKTQKILIRDHGSLTKAKEYQKAINNLIPIAEQELANIGKSARGNPALFHQTMIRLRQERGLWSHS